MASNSGEVVFDVNKQNDLTHEEIWDDTILIQQYDEALARVRKKLNTRLGTTESDQSEATTHSQSLKDKKNSKKKKKRRNKKQQDWRIGDICQAKYSVDGRMYEGTIVSLHPERNKATVQYVGYENEEEVSLRNVFKSRGPEARRKQEELADEVQAELSDAGSSMVESEMTSDTDGERSSKRPHQPLRASSCSHMMPPPFGITGNQFNPPPHLPHLPPPPALTMDLSDNARTSEALHTMLMSWYMTGYHTGYYQGLRQVDIQKKSKKYK